MRFPWQKKAPLLPAAQAYLDTTESRVDKKTPLAELRFIVLDAETTGFDIERDHLLSLAVLPVSAGQLALAQMRSWVIYQPATAINAAMRVHGILPDETAAGEPEPKVLQEMLPHFNGAILIGHHIGFDIAMLNAALRRHCHIQLRNPVLDTAQFAMRALDAFRKTGYPGQRAPSLDELCTHCDIAPMERHTAPGDTFTTAELFLVLCARLQRQLGRPLLADDLDLSRA